MMLFDVAEALLLLLLCPCVHAAAILPVYPRTEAPTPSPSCLAAFVKHEGPLEIKIRYIVCGSSGEQAEDLVPRAGKSYDVKPGSQTWLFPCVWDATSHEIDYCSTIGWFFDLTQPSTFIECKTSRDGIRGCKYFATTTPAPTPPCHAAFVKHEGPLEIKIRYIVCGSSDEQAEDLVPRAGKSYDTEPGTKTWLFPCVWDVTYHEVDHCSTIGWYYYLTQPTFIECKTYRNGTNICTEYDPATTTTMNSV